MWECPLGRRTVVRAPAPGEDVEGGKGEDGMVMKLSFCEGNLVCV